MVDLTAARRGPAAAGRLPRGGGGHGRSRRVLHEPAARRDLLARARVDRHPAPRGGRRGGRRVALRDALVHRRLRGARPEPELPHRGAAGCSPNPSLGWVRDKLEAEQHAPRSRKRYPAMAVTVLRFAPLLGPGRPHVLHAALRPSAWCRCCSATTRWCSSCIPTTRCAAVDAALEHGAAAASSTWCRAAP